MNNLMWSYYKRLIGNQCNYIQIFLFLFKTDDMKKFLIPVTSVEDKEWSTVLNNNGCSFYQCNAYINNLFFLSFLFLFLFFSFLFFSFLSYLLTSWFRDFLSLLSPYNISIMTFHIFRFQILFMPVATISGDK